MVPVKSGSVHGVPAVTIEIAFGGDFFNLDTVFGPSVSQYVALTFG